MGSMPKAEREYQLAHIHESRTPIILGFDSACLAITFVSTALRIVSKRIVRRPLGADDYTMLFAAAEVIAYAAVSILGDLKTSYGMHNLAVSASQGVLSQKITYGLGLLYSSSYYIIKISILLFYLRTFTIAWFRKVNIAAILLVACITFWMFLASVLTCVPARKFWDSSVNGKCIDLVLYYRAQASINIVTDFIVLLIPLPALWQLSLDRKTKLQLTPLFLLGILTCIVSVLRIVYYEQINPYDTSWTFMPATIATDVELTLAVVCANIPAYVPIAHIIRDHVSLPELPAFLKSPYSSSSASSNVTRSWRGNQSATASYFDTPRVQVPLRGPVSPSTHPISSRNFDLESAILWDGQVTDEVMALQRPEPAKERRRSSILALSPR